MTHSHQFSGKTRTCAYATLAVVLASACTASDDPRVAPDSAAVVDSAPAPQAPAPPAADSGAPRLQPADQADASFRSFRAATLAALSRQDTAYLYRILTPDIKNSFGGDDSIAGFKRLWRMAEPNSAVWSALTRVLQMGGEQTGDSLFVAPYVYAFWPDTIDAFEHVAVVSADAVLRGQPRDTARAIGTLSHSIVEVEEWLNLDNGTATDSTWVRVTVPNGPAGWLRGLDVYSPVGWRAFFVKRNGRWLMQLFVAGD